MRRLFFRFFRRNQKSGTGKPSAGKRQATDSDSVSFQAGGNIENVNLFSPPHKQEDPRIRLASDEEIRRYDRKFESIEQRIRPPRMTRVGGYYFPVPAPGQPTTMLRGVSGALEGQRCSVEKEIFHIGCPSHTDGFWGVSNWAIVWYNALDFTPDILPGRSPMHQDNTSALAGLASFARLEALLTARRLAGSPEAMMTFEAFAVELGRAVRGLANELKAVDLARYDVDAEAVMVDGQQWRTCLSNHPKTSLSASGPITVSRTLYRPAGGGKSICPLELGAGIIGGLHTPVLARQVTDLMGHLTSEATSQVCTELGIAGPSSSTCDRLPKRLSAVWASHRAPWEDTLREQEWVAADAAVVAVSLDGVMVPDKDSRAST
jgi:hypothetical protein